MKVTVEFDVIQQPNGVYIIDGVPKTPLRDLTKKVVAAYEAQKPEVFERHGYTIKKRPDVEDWAIWESNDTELIALVSGSSSEELWDSISRWAGRGVMRKYVRPGAVLAEFLEERGL